MNNKTLAITRACIPYFKELRTLTGSVTATILMQQLDYWFEKQSGEAFYKFKASCENRYYKDGDSFTEELGFSSEEFTTAFSKIGIAYKSKTEFESENDKFKGMFYCSYFDRKEGLTFYYRNHTLLDNKLNELFTINRQSQFTETDKANLQKPTKPISPIYIAEDYNSKLQHNIDKKIYKKQTDNLKSFQEIERFFQNKCNDSIDENLEIINNDFSKDEITLLAEFAINRIKGKNNIKNTKTALKSSIYNRAVKIKASLAGSDIDFKEVFRKDEDVYIYLMKDGGSRVIDSLDQWIVDRVLKDKQIKQNNQAKPRVYIHQQYTDQEMEEMMETQRKIQDKLQQNDFNG